VSRDMEYGLQSGGVATHGIRVPVQCPSGGECGVEAIPEDVIGSLLSAQLPIDRCGWIMAYSR
jgi:hypothetical protein